MSVLAGQRRRHLPAPGHLRGRDESRAESWRGTSTATAGSTWPSPIDGDNTVSVLLGNGDGTFQPQVTYAVGSNPGAIVAGDFTGDGRTDLAVSDEDGTQILLGNGDGTFQSREHDRAGDQRYVCVAGDFTGDGRLDLAVAGGGDQGTVSVLLGNGDGTFPPPVTYAVGINPLAIVAGDFNGDGRLDLAVANQGGILQSPGSVSVLLGNGDGTFPPRVTYKREREPSGIVAGDFNGDGHLDLALTNEDKYDQAGVTPFTPRRCCWATATAPSRPEVTLTSQNHDFGMAIAAGDFTGDGHLDLAIAEFISNSVSVLLGNGDGTFADPSQLATTPHATPLVADVNGDGTDDVLVVDGSGNILYRQGIPGQPGSFLPPVTVNPGNPSRDIAWLPNTNHGPVLASVDAQDDAISFYAYRDGRFVRLNGSLTTGQLPAQIIAAQLERRRPERPGRPQCRRRYALGLPRQPVPQRVSRPRPHARCSRFSRAAFTLPVGLGVSDVQAVDTTGSGRARPGRHQQADAAR